MYLSALSTDFAGFLNSRYGFLWLYVGFFVSILFFFWTVSVLFFFWTFPSFGKIFKLGSGARRNLR